MRLTQHIVVGVMRWRYLQATRTELDIYIAVLDNRNHAINEWHDDLTALQPLILRVLGVDTHSGIAHDSLRTRGGHNSVVALLVLMNYVALSVNRISGYRTIHIVLQMIEVALLFLVDDLFGRKGGQRLGIPVNHSQATIDEALVIEIHEDLDNALTALLVHGESRAVPVAGSAQTAQLLQDNASMLVGPCPGMLEEFFTSQLMLLDALLSEFLHHLGFCSDRSMIGARDPQRILALHASTADKNVLNGVVQHVAHVQHTRHIGWRNDDSVRLAAIRFRTEKFVVQPILVPFRFDLFGVIFAC